MPTEPDPLAEVRARAAWPDLGVDRDAFAASVAARVPPPPAAYLEDLYLAWACAQGAPRALALFRQRYRPIIAAAVRRFPIGWDEVEQQIDVRLFVPADGKPGRIARYSGTGPLGAWVRTFATRTALDELRRTRPGQPAAVDEVQAATGPGVALERAHHVPIVRQVIEACLAEVPAADRLVFKLHVIEGVSLDQVATLVHRHRSSLHRTVERVRARLAEEVPRRLARQLVASPDEVAALVADVWSRLSISVARVLDGE